MFHAGNIYFDIDNELVFKTDASGDPEMDQRIDEGDPTVYRVRLFCNNKCSVRADVEGLGETMWFDW